MSWSHEAEERARDEKLVASEKNTARYFTENRHVAWVALVLTILWGFFAYSKMPKAKDPFVEVRVAVAACAWPGASAEDVEQLVTRKIEQTIAGNAGIEKLESTSRTGITLVEVTLNEAVPDTDKEWNDIQARLSSIVALPSGAGAVQLQKDFGETTTLMLTVASPRITDVEIDLRAASLRRAIETIRATAEKPQLRATLVLGFPPEISPASMARLGVSAKTYFESRIGIRDARYFQSPGFLALDVEATVDDAALITYLKEFAAPRTLLAELHPDVWEPTVIRSLADTRARLHDVRGFRFSYRDLDVHTEAMERHLRSLPSVSRVVRSGVLPEEIHLEYSQERLASFGLDTTKLASILGARNISARGGVVDLGGKSVSIAPSGELRTEDEIGGIAISSTRHGEPTYLRDVVDIARGYQSPPRLTSSLALPQPDGHLEDHRAITLAVFMRKGAQIGSFEEEVDERLSAVKRTLPEGLVIQRTSDQPQQVEENVHLFMSSLYEAIALVVLVALVGFWEWRTALLLAVSIPITLAMTFGFMQAFGVDIQQVSIASLIIALGLLIDDPVVASDAIKVSLASGWKPAVAAWLGPTRLAAAILFATVTNIAAYLPFLTLSGDVGAFIHSLPVVLTLSLVASRIVSMTFVPLLGAALLRAPKVPALTLAQRRERGFGRFYVRAMNVAITHRRVFLGVSSLVLVLGTLAALHVKQAFFPTDLSRLSYVDIWLQEDASLDATRAKAAQVRGELADAARDYAREHGLARSPLVSVTSFVGAGGPRFWFSVEPEIEQQNYAQLVVQVDDKALTRMLVPYLQRRVSSHIAGARVDVRQLESGKPVGIPVAVRIAGEDIATLRGIADKATVILRDTPGAERARDDWGSDTFAVVLKIDSDRANMAGVTNLDIARSSTTSLDGDAVGLLREGNRELSILARLRPEERSQLSDLQNLYVYPDGAGRNIPLAQVSSLSYAPRTEKIKRRNQFRTITVACYPGDGVLPSEVLDGARARIEALRQELPPGYTLTIGGEEEDQAQSFTEMLVVGGLLLVAIYVALVVQFKNAVKPLIVIAALPFGVAAAFVSLLVTGAPLGFMAILGIISLMGVIVSHVIVLFDFIEEMHERGEPMREALLDAGLSRLRPVVVTVVATVLALVPLAMHGGPLWEPLCYAQIGGLSFATLVTLAIVPVLYTFFVEDLEIVRWSPAPARSDDP